MTLAPPIGAPAPANRPQRGACPRRALSERPLQRLVRGRDGSERSRRAGRRGRSPGETGDARAGFLRLPRRCRCSAGPRRGRREPGIAHVRDRGPAGPRRAREPGARPHGDPELRLRVPARAGDRQPRARGRAEGGRQLRPADRARPLGGDGRRQARAAGAPPRGGGAGSRRGDPSRARGAPDGAPGEPRGSRRLPSRRRQYLGGVGAGGSRRVPGHLARGGGGVPQRGAPDRQDSRGPRAAPRGRAAGRGRPRGRARPGTREARARDRGRRRPPRAPDRSAGDGQDTPRATAADDPAAPHAGRGDRGEPDLERGGSAPPGGPRDTPAVSRAASHRLVGRAGGRGSGAASGRGEPRPSGGALPRRAAGVRPARARHAPSAARGRHGDGRAGRGGGAAAGGGPAGGGDESVPAGLPERGRVRVHAGGAGAVSRPALGAAAGPDRPARRRGARGARRGPAAGRRAAGVGGGPAAGGAGARAPAGATRARDPCA